MPTYDMKVWQPSTVEEAWHLKQRLGSAAQYVSGGTWLQPQWQSGVRTPAHLISLTNMTGLHGIALHTMNDHQVLRIGALTSLAMCLTHPLIESHAPLVQLASRHIAAPGIRSQATIGGNVCSLVGDAIPALFVLGTYITVFNGTTYVTMPLTKYVESKQQSNDNEELVVSLSIPIVPKDMQIQTLYRKIGRRVAFVPALITTASYITLGKSGEITMARIAIGGGSHRPQRLIACEERLIGVCSFANVWKDYHQSVIDAIESYSDAFASADYRKKVAANLLTAHIAYGHTTGS